MKKWTGNTRRTGSAYEEVAEDYLKELGYRILARNFRCREGEIDLIARDGTSLVFIEVKYRSSGRMGSPLDAVDYRKQRRISRVALYYLLRHGLTGETPCRFDVVGITEEEICLLRDAFPFRSG